MINLTDHNASAPQLHGTVSLFGPAFMYPVIVVLIAIALVAAVGNVAVICTILSNRVLCSSTTHLFLLSLAISDLVTASLAMPFDIEFLFLQSVWKHGAILCVIYTTAWLIVVPTSILTLLAIGVDRFLSLKDPLRKYRKSQFSMTRRSCLIIISIIWIYSTTWALLPVMGWHVKGRQSMYLDMCMIPFTKLYSTLTSFLNFLMPLLLSCVISILAFGIALRHQRNAEQIFGTFNSQRHVSIEQNRSFAKNLKATKTTLMFLAAFFFCWQPYIYFSIVSNLYGREHWNPYPMKFRSSCMKLIRTLKPSTDPMQSTIRAPSTISSQSSSAGIAKNDSKEIRLQSIQPIDQHRRTFSENKRATRDEIFRK
ncbi:histamine H2 receptor-like isoform X2 [Acropora palmata]|uniref:histamine H2 receptor-like isoform X2 n=1 Tax=Acropora palmata TaxID=6131 RepID=UPI003DA03494